MSGVFFGIFLFFVLVPIVSVMALVVAANRRFKKKSQEFGQSEYAQISGKTYFDTLNDTGTRGEFALYKVLKDLTGDNRILTNLYIPFGNGKTTEIDVVLVNYTGIYVFESKQYRGWIFGRESDSYWTQTFRTGKKSRFLNPIIQNRYHIDGLKLRLQDIDPRLFYSIVVFGEFCELKSITATSSNVRVVQIQNLQQVLLSDMNSRTRMLSDEQINQIDASLRQYILADEVVKARHIENISGKTEVWKHNSTM